MHMFNIVSNKDSQKDMFELNKVFRFIAFYCCFLAIFVGTKVVVLPKFHQTFRSASEVDSAQVELEKNKKAHLYVATESELVTLEFGQQN